MCISSPFQCRCVFNTKQPFLVSIHVNKIFKSTSWRIKSDDKITPNSPKTVCRRVSRYCCIVWCATPTKHCIYILPSMLYYGTKSAATAPSTEHQSHTNHLRKADETQSARTLPPSSTRCTWWTTTTMVVGWLYYYSTTTTIYCLPETRHVWYGAERRNLGSQSYWWQ